jgi:hypothetical protein
MTNVSINAFDDHLRLTVLGQVDGLDEIVGYIGRLRAEAVRLGLRRVLLDYTGASFDMDYLDMRELAEIGTQNSFPLHGLRMAAVCPPRDLERHRLFETLAANRSIAYRVFSDEAEAMAYLLSP